MIKRKFITGALLGTGLCCSSAMAVDMSDIEIHGFASIGYFKSSDNDYLVESKDGSMEYNEFGINFRKEIDEKTSFGMQFFSRDLGDLGNNEFMIDWGYVDHKFNDLVGLRLGRVKLPSTLYNEYQDVDVARTTILMPQGVYSISFRDVTLAVDGLTAYGTFATPSAGDFEYNLYYGFLNIPENGSVKQALGADEVDSHMKYTAGGNLIYNTPLEGLRFNLSYGYTKDWDLNATINTVQNLPPTFAPVIVSAQLDLNVESFITRSVGAEYTIGDWIFAAEYLTRTGTFRQAGASVFDIRWGAWYVQADYRLDDRWAFAAYYADYLDDRDDTDGSGYTIDYSAWQKDLAFAARYDINDNWNVKAEVHIINGTALADTNDEEDWEMFALKTTVTF